MKEMEFTGRLLDYKEFVEYSNTFIETGTAAGDGVQRAIDAGFIYVKSCEAEQKWYLMSKEKFAQNKNVLIVQGKSVDFLRTFVSQVAPQVIFLDAHSAGPESFGHKQCVEGVEEFQQDNIIKKELAIILASFNSHVIMIDDVNGLKDGHAKEYMEMMYATNQDYKFLFFDECLSGDKEFYYKDKILVAIP